jgi:hypothetical protein
MFCIDKYPTSHAMPNRENSLHDFSEGKGRTFESCWVRQSPNRSLYKPLADGRRFHPSHFGMIKRTADTALRSGPINRLEMERAVGWRFASPTASHGKSLLPELCGQ